LYTVMIVDDVEVFRSKIKRLKVWGETSGFIITEEAVDGKDALNKLEHNPVDVVITDIKMPQMDGIELLRNIYEKNLCSYTVLLSDYTEYNYARQGFLYQAFDYLGKPVEDCELSKLLERIRQQLDEKKQANNTIAELNKMIEDTIYVATEVHQITDMICHGNKKVLEMTTSMIGTVGAYFNFDVAKALLILRNTLNKIIQETIKFHPWIPLYNEIHRLKNTDFSNCTCWDDITSTFNNVIEALTDIIVRFIGFHNNDIVKKVCFYIIKNINVKLSVGKICDVFYISKSYLCDIFKQKLGITIIEYITMLKMERAKILLRHENMKYYEIAYNLGFQDEEYFSKVFKKYVGMSLAEYRNK
jgi:two-component system, response regulator YesN